MDTTDVAPAVPPATPTPPVRGVGTSEFALSAAAFLLGTYLLLVDKNPTLGADLVTWATAGYVAGRVVLKGGISSALAALRGKA